MTREEAIKMLVNATYSDEWQGNEDLTTANHMAIEALKEKRPVGHWKEVPDMWDDTLWQCDHCGMEWRCIEGTPVDNEMLYCPKCGAYMKEE